MRILSSVITGVTLAAVLSHAPQADDDVIFGNDVAGSALAIDTGLSNSYENLAAAQPAPVKKEPGALQLVLEGVAMSIPEYILGVAKHEGSHALAVVIVGGKVTGMDLIPKMYNGSIRFGETSWQGTFTPAQDAFVDMAPKITDLTVMAAYTAALETGFYPENKHLQLLLLVVATSAWVDFSKDIFTKNPDNDTVKAWNDFGITTESQRLPYRILWGALAAGGAIEIGRGFYKLFKHGKEPPKDKNRASVDVSIGPAYVGVGGRF
ncbi:MAG: hypothetical protein HY074_06275 [Deltaproteobacteria bacterium]|nr:hypothetical protein [Deltaproteobacteria bacterium]